MNAIAARDAMFSELHNTVLKPLGFRKKGHWSILGEAPSFRTVYLSASRWSSAEATSFRIDIQVFRSDWFSLLWGPKVFPGPGEGRPSLVREKLISDWFSPVWESKAFPGRDEGSPRLVWEIVNKVRAPQVNRFEIDVKTDIDELTDALSVGLRTHALPLLQQCSSLEGILSYYESRKLNSDALSAAAVCLLLDREEQAKQFMTIAKETAPHENYLRWLQPLEKAMWANAAKR